MKTLICGLAAIGLFGMGVHAADADKVQISAQKKRTEAGAIPGKGSEKIAYDLILQNTTLGDLSQLTVEYIFFVERQKLGEKIGQEEHVDRISGSKTIDALSNTTPQTIPTEEIQINRSNLRPGYIYSSGGRIKAVDSVVGVWVRVSQNGEVIGEYANPPTVTKRGWRLK